MVWAARLCQCGAFVMFCAWNARIMTEVSEKFYPPKNNIILSVKCVRTGVGGATDGRQQVWQSVPVGGSKYIQKDTRINVS